MRLVYIVCLSVLLSFFSQVPAYAQVPAEFCHAAGLRPGCSSEDLVQAQNLRNQERLEVDPETFHERPAVVPGQEHEVVFTEEIVERPNSPTEQPTPQYREDNDFNGLDNIAGDEKPQRATSSAPQYTTHGSSNIKPDKNQNSTEKSGWGDCDVNDDLCQFEAMDQLEKEELMADLAKAHQQCIQVKRPDANQCCSENLAESSCSHPTMTVIIEGTNNIIQTMKLAAAYTSPAAICQANKKAYQVSSGLLIAATTVCAKTAGSCHNACGVSQFKGKCDLHFNKATQLEQHQKCNSMITEMKNARNACYGLQVANLGKASLVHTTNKYQDKMQQCVAELDTDANVPTCVTDEDFATKEECKTADQICKRPGSANLEICRAQDPTTAANGQVPDSIDQPSGGNGGNPKVPDGGGPFDKGDESQVPDLLAQALNNNDGGNDQQASGSGGGALAGGGGGGSGGGSSGKGGKAGPGKDRNILRGTSSGNGYISRRGRSGGGGYQRKSYSRSSASRGGSRGFPKFNLKKFLPKSKKITKGRLKGYNRLPSGNLMVPQNLDIFDVHHKSYKNACERGPIIKGCGPKASKKLGFAPTVRDLNSRYKAQLALQKELQSQRVSRSGIRVRSLKNNISAQANTTYYQIKYLNKNRLGKLPTKDPLASIGSKGVKNGKYKEWHKMQSWVNSKTGNRGTYKTPSNSRIPASVK